MLKIDLVKNVVQRMAIKRMLENIAKEVSASISYVNSGGCGVYAAEIGKRLQERGITDFKVRVYNTEQCGNLNDIENNLHKNNMDTGSAIVWGANNVKFYHIVIEFAGRIWDATGSSLPDQSYGFAELADGSITLDSVCKLADRAHHWNPMFARCKIPLMCQIMDKHFKAIDKKL